MATKQNVHGEGNYEATRQFNKASKKFVDSGRVEQAAGDAAPRNAKEAAEMKEAEQAALLRAKPEPPAVKDPRKREPAIKDPKRDPRLPDEIEAGEKP